VSFRAVFLLMAMSLCPSVSLAQETGSHLTGKEPARIDHEGEFTGSEAREILDAYASCLVKRRYMIVQKALSMPENSAEQYKAIVNLSQSECLVNGSLQFSAKVIRASLYKALVQKDFGRKLPVFRSSVQPSVGRDSLVRDFSACIVHREPAAVHRVLMARAGSKQETASLTAIFPALGECIDPASKLAFGKIELIGLLAESFYREAVASKSESAG